jgi:hypothetical protein
MVNRSITVHKVDIWIYQKKTQRSMTIFPFHGGKIRSIMLEC